MAGLRLHHVFYVVPNLVRNANLGRDFLRHFNCRIYYDLDKLSTNGRCVDLVEDAYLQTLIWLKRSIKLKPQSALFCFGKLPKTFSSSGCSHLQIAGTDQCFASKFPGIMLAHTITEAVKTNKLPLLLIDGTN